MGYWFVLISLLAGSTKGFLEKLLSKRVSNYNSSVFMNLIRMLICIFIGFGILITEPVIKVDTSGLIFGILAGISISVFTITWLLAIKYGAFMLVSIAQMFGVIVTLLLSFVVFGEKATALQVLGVILVVIAILIMISYNNTTKGKLTKTASIFLFLCGLSSGLLDFSQKLFTHYSEGSVALLNFITYVSATILLGAYFVGFSRKDASVQYKKLFKGTFLVIFAMSVCLFLHSYFKALATKYLLATQIYPVYQSGGLILSALMSAIFFKEKITKRCIIGICIAFIAILLLK